MKYIKKLCLTIACLLSIFSVNATTASFYFDYSTFSFTELNDGTTLIASLEAHDMGNPEPGVAQLPWIFASVSIPTGHEYKDCDATANWSVCKQNYFPVYTVLPMSTTLTLPSHDQNDKTDISTSNTVSHVTDNVKYIGSKEVDGDYRACFVMTPFAYDEQLNELLFTEVIQLNINFVPSSGNAHSIQPLTSLQYPLPRPIENSLSYSKDATIDYIIVTASSFAPFFQPLIEAKRKKGLNCDIITLDSIYRSYPESRQQLSIKRCLKELYLYRKLQFVLLGGDGTIVPSQTCRSLTKISAGPGYEHLTQTIGQSIPTDLFYASFGGSFHWDRNGDGIIGDADDGVDFTPVINVTRAPFYTPNDITAYVNKLITYETEPNKFGWTNRMLLGGCAIDTISRDKKLCTYTDVYYWSNMMLERHIAPFWHAPVDQIFDSYNSVASSAPISKPFMMSRLNSGYAFISFSTHGATDAWRLYKDDFTSQDALSLQNPHPSIISSTACYTNNFGTLKPNVNGNKIVGGYEYFNSLASAFLRNPRFGAIAYLGNTSQGLSYPDTTVLSDSKLLEALVFRHLFSYDLETRRLSSCLNKVRTDFANHDIPNDGYRFLLFSLNLSGDPETELFVTNPKKFGNIQINNLEDSAVAGIDPVVTDCKIRVGYIQNNGIIEFEDPELLTGRLSNRIKRFKPKRNSFVLSISHDGYIPYTCHYQMNTRKIGDTVYLRNEKYDEDMYVNSKVVVIGNSAVENAYVNIIDGYVNVESQQVHLLPNTFFKKGCTVKINNNTL